MIKAVLDALLSQGPLGVVIAGMAIWLWRLETQLMRVQEQRVKDAFRIAEITNAFSLAIERNTETLRAFLGPGTEDDES